jgi:hypothetical protein
LKDPTGTLQSSLALRSSGDGASSAEVAAGVATAILLLGIRCNGKEEGEDDKEDRAEEFHGSSGTVVDEGRGSDGDVRNAMCVCVCVCFFFSPTLRIVSEPTTKKPKRNANVTMMLTTYPVSDFNWD